MLEPGDALGTLLYLVHPFKSESFFEVADRIRLFLRLFPEEEMEVLGRYFGVYLQMPAEKEAIDPERITEDLLKGKGVEEMLTYVEKEMRRCAQEGREEGRMEGREEVAVRLLELGMTISLVSETTKVPEERVRELAGLKG